MDSSYQLKLSPSQQQLVQQGQLNEELLVNAVGQHADQIGYMLQAYYPREKVSGVAVVPGSMVIKTETELSLKLEYVKEEFNACSAVDTELKETMTVTVYSAIDPGILTILGESWPEL